MNNIRITKIFHFEMAHALHGYDGKCAQTLTEVPSPTGFDDINRGFSGAPSISYNSKVYMKYRGNDGNYDLFEYDGTTLTEIPSPSGFAGSGNGYDDHGIVFNSYLYLSYEGDDGNSDLFKYDGSVLTEIPSPLGYTGGSGGYVGGEIIYNGNLYLKYRTDAGQYNLFRFDGATLTEIPSPTGYATGSASGYFGHPIVYDGSLYMQYRANNGTLDLMKYDGTSFTPIPSPSGFSGNYLGYHGQPVVFGGNLYLQYYGDDDNYTLFKYDGLSLIEIPTPSGFTAAGGGYLGLPFVHNSWLYFQYMGDDQNRVLFKNDGTSLTEISSPAGYSGAFGGYHGSPVIYNSELHVLYKQDNNSNKLFKYDGTSLSVIPNPTEAANSSGGYAGHPIVVGPHLYVYYQNDDQNGGLFRYDGVDFTHYPSPTGFSGTNAGYTGWPHYSNYVLHVRYKGDDGNYDLFSLEGCPPVFSSFPVTECNSYTVPSGDETYTVSGEVMDTIPSLLTGCDSIMTIDVNILQPTVSQFSVTECNSYTVPSGDEIYTVSGEVMDTIPSLLTGCDSIMTIDVNILQPTASQFSVTTCDSYTVPSGDETYTLSDTYMDTIQNVAGCDSVMTIDVTIDNGCVFPAGGLNFDGVNDYVNIPQNSSYNFGTNDFTIEAWVRTSSTDFQIITQKRSGSNSGTWFRLALSSGRPFLEISTSALIMADNSIADGNWHHIAAVRYSSFAPKIYVDGVEVSASANGNFAASISNANAISIGSNLGSCCFFNGDMDELRFWTEARSAGDIQGLMNCALWGIPAELLGYFKFDHGYVNQDNSGETTLEDETSNINHGTLYNFTLMGLASNWVEDQPNCLTVGVDEEMLQTNQFNIYPNPVSEIVNISSESMNYRFSLFDMAGKVVKSESIFTNNHQLDVSDLAAGIYAIRFESANGLVETRRLLIER